MNNEPLGPKDPQEVKVIKFPFARDLAGASIASITSVTAAVYRGVDASPAGVLLGAPVVSGTDVLQRIQAGVNPATYKLRAVVLDSNGNVHVATDLVAVRTL